MKTIGARIYALRKKLRFDQRHFGLLLGISQTHVSKIENNVEKPSNTLTLLICSRFNVNNEWLLHGDDDGNLNLKMFTFEENAEFEKERFETIVINYKKLYETATSDVKKEQYSQIIENVLETLTDDSYWYTNNMDVEPWRFHHMTYYLEIITSITRLVNHVRATLEENEDGNVYKSLYNINCERETKTDEIKNLIQKLVSNMCNDIDDKT